MILYITSPSEPPEDPEEDSQDHEEAVSRHAWSAWRATFLGLDFAVRQFTLQNDGDCISPVSGD